MSYLCIELKREYFTDEIFFSFCTSWLCIYLHMLFKPRVMTARNVTWHVTKYMIIAEGRGVTFTVIPKLLRGE